MDVTIQCICPPKADGEPRHEQDTITLRDPLHFRDAMALQKDMAMAGSDDDATVGDSLAALTEGYMLAASAAWTLVDAKGKPIEADTDRHPRLAAVATSTVAMDVSAAAEELYNPSGAAPFSGEGLDVVRTWPTEPSTSAPTGSPRKPRKPSRPSSTSTTPTDGIATITPSPAGDSRSSRNGTSVRPARASRCASRTPRCETSRRRWARWPPLRLRG